MLIYELKRDIKIQMQCNPKKHNTHTHTRNKTTNFQQNIFYKSVCGKAAVTYWQRARQTDRQNKQTNNKQNKLISNIKSSLLSIHNSMRALCGYKQILRNWIHNKYARTMIHFISLFSSRFSLLCFVLFITKY